MALKDVKEFYFSVEQSYFSMKKVVDELDSELKRGNVTEDQVTQSQQLMQIITDNYNRLGYIMFLMAKPRRKSKQSRFDAQNSYLKNYFGTAKATKEFVDIENADALCGLKRILKEIKGEVNE